LRREDYTGSVSVRAVTSWNQAAKPERLSPEGTSTTAKKNRVDNGSVFWQTRCRVRKRKIRVSGTPCRKQTLKKGTQMMKMILTPLSCVAVLAAATLAASAQFQLLQEWDFTTADPNLNPTQVSGSVPGGVQFSVGGSGQLTTGDTLRLSPSAALNSHVELTDIPNLGIYHTLRAEFDIAGWDWSGGAGSDALRRLSVGFAGNAPPADNFLFAANASIRLNAAGEFRFTAESGGTGGTSLVGTAPVQGDLTAVHTDAVFIRIDWDVANALYSVYISDTAGAFEDALFDGAVGSERAPNRLRLGPLDGIPWGSDYIDVDAVRLYGIPEPSTYALGILGLAALYFARRRKS
jgi:hypothetical protein